MTIGAEAVLSPFLYHAIATSGWSSVRKMMAAQSHSFGPMFNTGDDSSSTGSVQLVGVKEIEGVVKVGDNGVIHCVRAEV